MRRFLTALPVLMTVSCVDTPADVPPPPVDTPDETATAPVDTVNTVQLVPLTGSGLRYDGVYRFDLGGIRYYMRFFERGSAAFVGGTEKKDGELAGLLTMDVKSGWNSVHNCPVDQRNDSLFIRSVGMKGVINYAGQVHANGDSLRLLRVSEINGVRQLFNYGFVPDVRP